MRDVLGEFDRCFIRLIAVGAGPRERFGREGQFMKVVRRIVQVNEVLICWRRGLAEKGIVGRAKTA